MTGPPRAGAPIGIERRKNRRSPVSFSVTAEGEKQRVRIQAGDIAIDGLGALSDLGFPLQTPLTLGFNVSGTRQNRAIAPISVRGVVARCEPDAALSGAWRLGIAFSHQDPASRARMERFLRSIASDNLVVA